MSKISLVTRRQDKRFAPTAALQRAQSRALESRPGSTPVRDSAPEPRTTFPSSSMTAPCASTHSATQNVPNGVPESIHLDPPAEAFGAATTQKEANFSMTQNDRLRDQIESLLGGEDEAVAHTKITRNNTGNQCIIQINILPHEEMKMLSAREVSEVLGVSPGTVIRLCKRGELKGYKIGHNWRFSWHEVMTSLNNSFSPTLN